MPFTFLSHQAPVVPLKLAFPNSLDCTAMVIGSVMPDLVFALHGTDWYVDAHTVWPQLWFCLPATIAATWIVKRKVAGTLGPHLPAAGQFQLRDYRLLSAWTGLHDRRAWVIVILSALIGSFSHIVFDSFTHGFGWVVQHVDFLQQAVFNLPAGVSGHTVYVHDLLQIGATIMGAAITIWCLHYIGKHRCLRRWYPNLESPEPTTRSRRLLWGSTAVGLAIGVGVAAATVHVGGAQDLIIRVADFTFVGMFIGCVSCSHAMQPTSVATETA